MWAARGRVEMELDILWVSIRTNLAWFPSFKSPLEPNRHLALRYMKCSFGLCMIRSSSSNRLRLCGSTSLATRRSPHLGAPASRTFPRAQAPSLESSCLDGSLSRPPLNSENRERIRRLSAQPFGRIQSSLQLFYAFPSVQRAIWTRVSYQVY